MATIKNGTFKDLTGSFGHSYLRVKNGKQEVCAKPSRYTLSMNERPVAIRGMMHRLSFVSKHLMKDKFFYDLWKIKEIKGAGPYHKFISINHFGKQNTLDLGKLRLSPFLKSFPAEIDTFSITQNEIKITLKPIGADAGIDTFREPFILSRGMLLCSGCRTTTTDTLDNFDLETKRIPIDLENPIQLTYEGVYPIIWEEYKELRVLLILATLNSEEKLVQTSVTMSCFVNTEE